MAAAPYRLTNPEAWFLPAFLLLPILLLQVIQWVQPAYMNARHLSLISGAFLLLVAGGLAAVWHFRRWGAIALGVLLLVGSAYSTYNYYYSPEYAKDHFVAVGVDLAAALQPGDGLVMVPTEMVRLYRHYLPLDLLARAMPAEALAADEPRNAWQSLPQLGAPWEVTEARLRAMLGRHRRIWLVASRHGAAQPFQQESASGSPPMPSWCRTTATNPTRSCGSSCTCRRRPSSLPFPQPCSIR